MKYWESKMATEEVVTAEVTSSSEPVLTACSLKPDNETGKGTATSPPPDSANPFHFEAAKYMYVSKKINIHPSNYKEFQPGQESLRRQCNQTSNNDTPPHESEMIDKGDQTFNAADELNISPGPQWTMFDGRWSVGGKRECFLLASIGAPPSDIPDIVPLQGEDELTEDDLQKLESQGIPAHCRDDISILRARIKLDPNVISLREEVSTTGRDLTCGYVLEQLTEFLDTVKEKGAVIYYVGHGKERTGDWCFKDGFITFRDIMHLYNTTRIKGRVLTLVSNCSYSGSWVQECCQYLDEQGIAACGHAAVEKGILLKVDASCKPSEIANSLVYSTQGMENDKNTGSLKFYWSKELRKSQTTAGIPFTDLRCGQTPQDPCTLQSTKYTWMKRYQGDLIYLIKGTDKGRDAWYYILLVDDSETIRAFKEALESPTINLENYGEILHSGYGKEPPNELRDELEKQYLSEYK